MYHSKHCFVLFRCPQLEDQFTNDVVFVLFQFDINDWAKNCSRELFRRSSKSRLLLKAIHALASRHLTNLSQLEPERAEHYHNECMNDLIPRLTNPEVLVDDHIFAATVILRTKEEMEGEQNYSSCPDSPTSPFVSSPLLSGNGYTINSVIPFIGREYR